MQLESSGCSGQSLFADRNFSSLPPKSSCKHAQPCFPEADNLTKSVLISTRNAPSLPNFKFLFQSMEAPEVLKQRDVRKKKYILAKLPFFPNLLLKLGKMKKKKKKRRKFRLRQSEHGKIQPKQLSLAKV